MIETREVFLIQGQSSPRLRPRGYAPMYKIYPKADVLVVQLSLRQGLDPAEHVELGLPLRFTRHRLNLDRLPP